MEDKILDWIINSNDKGVSSEAMAAVFLGKDPETAFGNHPSDPSDFNRCLLLLHYVPEARTKIKNLASISEIWGKLVERWDELEQCLLDEVGLNWSKGQKLSASKTYKLMKEIGC